MLKTLFMDLTLLVLAEDAYSKPDNDDQKAILTKIRTLRPKVELLTREVYAKTLERNMMDKNFNAQIDAKGQNKQTLQYKYPLMSRVMAYKMANDGAVFDSARKAGFKKVIFTNGLDTWEYQL